MMTDDIPKNETDTEENSTQVPWDSALMEGATTSMELASLEIPPRKKVIDDWCYAGDLGFVFAARGLGKTWLGMFMAHCAATNVDIGPWKIHDESIVLYLDGEMPPSDVKSRDHGLGRPTDNLIYVNHEILFERTGQIMNLTHDDFQNAIMEMCKAKNVNILVLDNLSTLASGVDENNGIEWERITPFLMKLRRAHITVIFIHHASRGGQMRGHSKREDPSAWIIRLDNPRDADEDFVGAHFITRFTKWRNASKQPKTYTWVFAADERGDIKVRTEVTSPIDVFRRLVELGMNSCSDIAKEMDVTNGYVSQLAARAVKEGWMEIKGKKYVLKEGETGRTYYASADA